MLIKFEIYVFILHVLTGFKMSRMDIRQALLDISDAYEEF